MNRSLTISPDTLATADLEDKQSWLYWDAVNSHTIAECKVFSVNETYSVSKCGKKKESNFFTLNCEPWVNVIALTEQNEVIMVEQYRHGVGELTLEIPGGSIDDSDVDPCAAAIRELKEETGCVAKKWTFLGKNHPNPAIQGNLCYTFLAEGAVQVECPKFDGTGTEKIHTCSVPLSEISSLIRQGNISHALVITAFHFLLMERPDLV